MTDPVFERYKEALKRGHVAVFRGRPKEALASYQEAARLVEPSGAAVGEHGFRAAPDGPRPGVDRGLRRGAPAVPGRSAGPGRQGDGAHGRGTHRRGRGARGAAVETLDVEESQLRAAAAASALDASWGRGPERLAGDGRRGRRRDGDIRSAVEGFVAAAAEYQELGYLDAALDACYARWCVARGRPGHPPADGAHLPPAWAGSTSRRSGWCCSTGCCSSTRTACAQEELFQLASQNAGISPALAALVNVHLPGAGPRRPA